MSKTPVVCRGSNGRPKDRFTTRQEAQKALNRAWRRAQLKSGTGNPFLPCRIYWCDKCKGFHQTSAPKIRPRRR